MSMILIILKIVSFAAINRNSQVRVTFFLFFSCITLVYLSFYLSICLSIYLSIYLSTYLSIYLSTYSFIYNFSFFSVESIYMYPHYFENQSIIILIWHYSFLRLKHSYFTYFFHIIHSHLWDCTTFFFFFFLFVCPCFTHWVDRRGRWSGKSLLVWYNKRNLSIRKSFSSDYWI